MQQTLHNDIRKVIRSIRFISGTSYSINGMHRDMEAINIIDPSGALKNSNDKAEASKQKYLNVLLTDIYNNLYHATKEPEQALSYLNNDFILDLSAANLGTGAWEEGWLFAGEDITSKKLVVRKEKIKCWVEPGRVRTNFEPGTSCLVKVEKENRFLNPHFYFAYGDTHKTEVNNYAGELLRFYWNLTPKGAIAYMHAVTKKLNELGIVFSTKVLTDYTGYTRADAGVLYIDASQLELVLEAIPYIYTYISSGIKPSVPLFVKHIYPGLGFAEDPKNGMSFGISRSKIIAETLYNCFHDGIHDKEEVEYNLYISLENAGISAAQPYTSASRLHNYESLLNKLNPLWN